MQVSLSDLLERIDGKVVNPVEVPPTLELSGPSELAGSRNGQIAFFFNKTYVSELPTARPSVLITGEAFVGPLSQAGLPLWSESLVVAARDPYLAMARVTELFAPELDPTYVSISATDPTVIEPSATVDPRAKLGRGTVVRAGAIVEAGATIGEGSYIGPGCWIGHRATLGARAHLVAKVSIYPETVIGSDFRAHSGVVIGSDGFGYAPITVGGRIEGHQKIWHLGRVTIGDRVEIGANSCADRGTLGDTVIEDDVKIDNLCHVGHNSRLGKGAILCGGVLLAGRAVVEKFAYIGGNTGITNGVVVGAGAKVGATSLVTKDVPAGGTAVGNPQRNYHEHFKAHAALNRLTKAKKDANP